MATDFVSLREAVKATLDGQNLLDSPDRMKGCILDLADSTAPEVKLVAQQYDADLAAHLLAAVKHTNSNSLVTARSRIAQELEEGRFVNHDLSWAAADGLAGGLADHLGVALPPMENEQAATIGFSALKTGTPQGTELSSRQREVLEESSARPQPQPEPLPQPDPASQYNPAPTAAPMQQQAQPTQPAKKRVSPVLVGVAIALVAAVVIALVLVLPTQTTTNSKDKSQDLGWDKVPLYDGGGVWVMTGMVEEFYDDSGSTTYEYEESYEIDEHGNRLSMTVGSDEGPIRYYQLDGSNESGWPTRITFLNEDNTPQGSSWEIEYFYTNPQLFKVETKERLPPENIYEEKKTYKTYGEYRAIGTKKYFVSSPGEDYDEPDERYAWEYDSSSRPTTCTIGDYVFTFTYDEHGCIERMDGQNVGNGEYWFYEPSYAYVEHPSMWAYICSRMYDIDPNIY